MQEHLFTGSLRVISARSSPPATPLLPPFTGRVMGLVGLAAVIPLVLLTAWAMFLSADRNRNENRATAIATAERVAETVAAELSKELEVVTALASSPTLDSGDLAGFYALSIRLAQARPLWETVSLSDPQGEQLLNVLRPLGADLAPDPDPETLATVLNTGKPVIGGVGPVGPISGMRLVPLRVPVFRDGALRFVLTVGLNPQRISSIISHAGAPKGWIGDIIDRHGEIVARSNDSSPAQPSAAASAHGGELAGSELEIVTRPLSGLDGWTVRFGIPRAILDAPVNRSQAMLVLGGSLSVGLSIVLSLLIARDLTHRRRIEADRAELALRLSEQVGALAIEAAELGAWRWDPGGRRVTGSSKAVELAGLSKRAAGNDLSFPARRILAVVHPEDRADLAAAARLSVESGTLMEREFRLGLPVSGYRWVRAIGRRLEVPGTSSHVLHGVLASVDIQKQSEEERRRLLRRLAELQEDERRRIARELHDQIGQYVTGLSLGLKDLERRLQEEQPCPRTPGSTLERVRWLQDLAREIGQDVHRVSSDLRPTALDDLGLVRAILALGSDIERRHGLRIDVHVLGIEDRLPSEVETALYRALQEALTNVLKHASAKTVSIVIERRNDQVKVVVEDDGVGFDPEVSAPARSERSLGLSGIRERLALFEGDLRIESAPASGAALFIRVPLTMEAQANA